MSRHHHHHAHEEELHSHEFGKGQATCTLISGLFLALGFLTEHINQHFTSIFFYGLSILFGAWHLLPTAFHAIRTLRPDIHLLMVIAIMGAAVIGQWIEGAAVAFLFAISIYLESWSVGKARHAVAALIHLTPTIARVKSEETQVWVDQAVEKVAVGSIILIRPGETIPMDAEIMQGSSSVNQSPITGESLPVFKQEGDEVFAGTFNAEGALVCKVTKKSTQSTLARMSHLVEEARKNRSQSEQWIDTFARYYTPIILIFALLVMVIPPFFLSASWLNWIYQGLVLLVIACPCALVLATPISIICGLTCSAHAGILVKGGIYLELVGKLKAIAIDKTGTLTQGHPVVQKIVPLNGHTPDELMERALALEQSSEHPLARAIMRKGKEMGIQTEGASHYQSVKGKGALATYQGRLFWIGSHRFMHDMGQETEEVHRQALALEDAGHSIIALGNDEHVCGLISIADAPRPNIEATIQNLKNIGIEQLMMLTGDNFPTAEALARFAKIDLFHAELLPEEKVEKVLEFAQKWETVGMVGDGVNDTPAMAASTVGIAMGGMGSPAAIETADIVLMSDDLNHLTWLILQSRKVVRVIKQNIAISLTAKGIFILLALFNLATLWLAIVADTGTTLVVIFNALRLLKNRFNGISPKVDKAPHQPQ